MVAPKPPNVISLELNELNFDLVELYIARGQLKGFAELLRTYSLVTTKAEDTYRDLEPWIQWPTVYTGKTFADHNIFRLGDGIKSNLPQIWDLLERRNIKVGAISPMNARNNCRAPAFFLPDPWTETPIVAPAPTTKLFMAIRNLVNANAHEKYRMADLWAVAFYGVRVMRRASLDEYARIFRFAIRYKWARALLLDRILADLFIELWTCHEPNYASLFLNAAAHVQHHHMYESAVYTGERRNPDWYSASRGGDDPLAFTYEVYDRIVRDVLSLSADRIMITTALSQRPNAVPYFQYRPVDHKSFLAKFDIKCTKIVPRMSRDFSLFFETSELAQFASSKLKGATMADGHPVFAIEERGPELFCQISFRGEREAFAEVRTAADERLDLLELIAVVSIENAVHQTTGFHIDTGRKGQLAPSDQTIPLTEVFQKTLACFELAG